MSAAQKEDCQVLEPDRAAHTLGALAHARVVIADWKEDYNHRRCHSALGYQAPAQYAINCIYR